MCARDYSLGGCEDDDSRQKPPECRTASTHRCVMYVMAEGGLGKPPISDESVGTGSDWLSRGQSLPIKTKFFAGHSNRTTVLFRPKVTPTTLLKCAASSKSWFPQL